GAAILVILEFKPAFTGRVSQSLYLPMIDKAAAIENHLGNLLSSSAVCEELTNFCRRRDVWPNSGISGKLLFGGVDRRNRASGLVVNDLCVNMLARKGNRQPRSLRCSRDLFPKPLMAHLDRRERSHI